MHEEARVGQPAGGLFEHTDEELTDHLALLLGIGDACEPLEEAVGRLHVHELDALVTVERVDDLLALARPHQTRVDVDAGELVTHGLVHQRGRNGRVDSTREPADHTLGRPPAHGSRRPTSR